nr:hypothetical protein [uncultured Agathobaculum sp.]
MKQFEATLHYRAAYLALFSDVAALAEQIETAGAYRRLFFARIGFSLIGSAE